MTYTWRHVYWVYCHLSVTNNFSPHSSRTWPTQAAETASAQSLHPCLFLSTHACWRGPVAPPSLPLCVPRLWSSMCSHPGTRRSIWWSRGVVEGKGLHLPCWGSSQPSPINLLDRHRHYLPTPCPDSRPENFTSVKVKQNGAAWTSLSQTSFWNKGRGQSTFTTNGTRRVASVYSVSHPFASMAEKSPLQFSWPFLRRTAQSQTAVNTA